MVAYRVEVIDDEFGTSRVLVILGGFASAGAFDWGLILLKEMHSARHVTTAGVASRIRCSPEFVA
jgi:hypothetical protein